MNRKNIAIRALVVLMCTAMLIGMIPVCVSAADKVTVVVGEAELDLQTATAADGYYSVDVPITITNNTGFVTLRFDVAFPDNVTLDDWTEGTVLPYIDGTVDEGEHERSLFNTTAAPADMSDPHVLTVVYSKNTSTANVTAIGTLMTLKFKVPESVAVGDLALTATLSEVLEEDGDKATVPAVITDSCSVTSGKIAVKQTVDYAVFNASDLSVTIGGSNLESKGVSEYTDADGYTSDYLRIAPKAASVGNTAANTDFFFMYLPEEASLLYTDYPCVVVGYKTSITSNTTMNFVVGISEKAFPNSVGGDDKYFYAGTPLTSGNVTTKLVRQKPDHISLNEGTAPNHKFLRITPYFNAKSAMTADDFFDVEYIGYFKNEAAANAYVHKKVTMYTITFQDKDGVVISSKKYAADAAVALPEAPVVDGYAFEGWSTGVDGEALITEDFTASKDLTLTAQYKEIVDLDCVVYDAEEIASDRALTEVADGPTNKVECGKVALKGYVDGYARFGTSVTGDATASTTDDRLIIGVDNVVFKDYPYAVIVYKTNIAAANLNFNFTTANGSNSVSDRKIFAPQARVVDSAKDTVGEYTYDPTGALSKDDAANGLYAEVTSVYVPLWSNTSAVMKTADYFDVKYIGFFKSADDYAKFDYDEYLANKVVVEKFLITFQDKDGNVISSTKYEKDAAVELPTAPTVDGYAFEGWSTGVDGEALITENFTASKDLTLTAQYRLVSAGEFTVTYKNKDGETISAEKYTAGSPVTLPTPPKAPEGFEFAGWAKEDGTVVPDGFTVTGDVVLTATYKQIVAGEAFAITPSDYAENVVTKTGDLQNAVIEVLEEDGVEFARINAPAGGKAHTSVSYIDVNNSSKYPIKEYPILALKYRTNINKDNVKERPVQITLFMNKDGKTTTFFNRTFRITNDGEFNTAYVDISAFADWSTVDDDSPLYTIRMLPWGHAAQGSGIEMVDGEYFDIAYIGSFKSQSEAENFTFTPVNVKIEINGQTVADGVYSEGTSIELPTPPHRRGYEFQYWEDNLGNKYYGTYYSIPTGTTGAIQLTAVYADLSSGNSLKTLITILKMIDAKKANGDVTPAPKPEPTPTPDPEPSDKTDTPAEPAGEFIIYTAQDMVNDGRLADSATVSEIKYANVQQKGLTEDGYVRFVSAAAGTASKTSDRAVINVDNVKLQDYPYAVLAYRTNIKCDNVNFNMVTANGTYPATETKIFFPQARVADGKLQKAYANYKGTYGAAEATDIYVPVWSNSSAVMGADDYFDVKYIAFFKTEKEAKAYNG